MHIYYKGPFECSVHNTMGGVKLPGKKITNVYAQRYYHYAGGW